MRTYLLLLAATAASAQVHLQYLDLGPSPSPCCMVADAKGNTYVAGGYQDGVTSGGMTARKIIVSKIGPAGNLIYRSVFGGSGVDAPTAVAVDANGNLFVVGVTSSVDFPLVNPLIRNAADGEGQGFLSKINASGTLVASTFIGGLKTANETSINAINLDAAGNAYITGFTYATDFPVTPGAYETSGNAFVMKFSNAGNQILLSTFIGSSGNGLAIAVDRQGAITVGGSTGTAANGFPATPGAFQTTCGCFQEPGNPLFYLPSYSASFVLRLSPDGTHLLWSTYLGGTPNLLAESADTVQALALTSDGGVVVAGAADSSDFPVTPGAFQSPHQAGGNIFITRLNATGTALTFSSLLGDSAGEVLNGFQLDAQERPWITGPTNLPTPPYSLGFGDEFVTELASDGSKLLETQLFPYGSAGVALSIGTSGVETLLGSSGSLLQIPAGSLSGISILAQANAFSSAPTSQVSPGEVFYLYGTSLGPSHSVNSQFDAAGKLPTKLEGIEVTCNGIPAPLLYVSANQVNAVMPFEVSGQPSVSVQVKSSSSSTAPLQLNVVPAYPEIYTQNSELVALNQDGSVNSSAHPAKFGSNVTFWVNGAGLYNTTLVDGEVVRTGVPQPVLPVSVWFGRETGGELIPATYGSAVGYVAGFLQITATLPAQSVPAITVPLQVQIGDFVSDLAYLHLQ